MLLKNGFPTLISFSQNPALSFEEKTVTTPGLDGGDPIDTTTMRNVKRRTKHPRALIDTTPGSTTAAYDPVMYQDLTNIINVLGQITVTEPDGSTIMFWGWLRSFTPNEESEGEQPTAVYAFELSNEDDLGNEVDPDYTAPP